MNRKTDGVLGSSRDLPCWPGALFVRSATKQSEGSRMKITRSHPVVGAISLVAALAPATASAARDNSRSAGCKGGTGTSLVTTPNYRFQLHIGMPEKMYTVAQVKKMHPKSGEMMVSGDMSMAGMSMGSNSATRHLEVQICSKKTGAVITNAHPTITVKGSKSAPTTVPSARCAGYMRAWTTFTMATT